MIPGVDTSGMGTYEIMNLIKAMLKDQPTPQIVDRLKTMIPEATAPAMTLDEIMATIETRLTAKKALDEYMDRILTRLKVMTGVDVGNVDDGLVLAETKIEDANQIWVENASLHRILGRVKAKVNALILDPREKITDLCQALDVVQAEYDRVKERAVERENMISDAIGELRLILGVPKTEDLTLAQIVGVLKAKASEGHEHHTRLCGAVHMLTTTPADRVVNEIVRVVGSRDYYVKALLSRFVNEGVAYNDKTVDEVLSMIEAQHKTVTERLGTSYAREIELTKEVAEAKFALEQCLKVHAHTSDRLEAAGATLNMIMERIQGMTPSMLCLQDLVEMLGTSKAMDANEAMRRATDKIRYAQKQTSRLIKILGDGEAQDLHGAVDKIQNMVTNMRPSMLILAELATALGMSTTASVNEAMRRATDKIKALRDLLNF